MGMHWGRYSTYNSLARDFYWRNLAKHVCKYVRRCPHCIRLKTVALARGPMQLTVYEYPFHTLGVDYVGELPVSPMGNKSIMHDIPVHVPNKSAPTAATSTLSRCTANLRVSLSLTD